MRFLAIVFLAVSLNAQTLPFLDDQEISVARAEIS
jgi:hypothetical protein